MSVAPYVRSATERSARARATVQARRREPNLRMNQAPAAISAAMNAVASATMKTTFRTGTPASASAFGCMRTRKKKPFRWKPTEW